MAPTAESAFSSLIGRETCAPESSGLIVVMGMSRSGTSLTTSMMSALLGGAAEVWRGSGAPYPADRANPGGYFERQDVVRLNYDALRALGTPWHAFPSGFEDRPAPLHAANGSARFNAAARAIVADMGAHAHAARGRAAVLKDVRFARTLPLWWPLLPRPLRPLVCVVPIRHPAEVVDSSMLHSVVVWRNYMLSALVTARALGCPTALVPYDRWLHPNGSAERQLSALHAFLRCAGIGGLPAVPPLRIARELVRPAAHHHRSRARALPPSVSCLWDELSSGRALRWPWDAKAQRFAQPLPCASTTRSSARRTSHVR